MRTGDISLGELLDDVMLKSLRKLTRPGEEDFLNQMVGLFIERFPVMYQQLEDAYKAQDWFTLSRMAHALKGSCANIGAKALAGLCQKLETEAAKGPVSDGALQLERLKRMFEISCSALKTWSP